MTSNKDIFIRFFFFVVCYELIYNLNRLSFLQSNLLFAFAVAIILVTVYLLIIKNLKDKKRIGELIQPDLAAMNYTVLAERPLTLKEHYENFEFEFGLFLNGISLDFLRYKNRMKRHFVVRNEKDYDFELIITIIQTWRNKFNFKIENTSRIRN